MTNIFSNSRTVPNSLQQETGEDFELESMEQEAYLAILRTASLLEAEGNRVFKTYGLTGASYNILRVLERAGKSGRNCGDIGRRLITDVPDITRLIDRLEKLNLVTRERAVNDRRVVHVTITPSGRKAVNELKPQLLELQEALIGHLGQSKLRTLILGLATIRRCPGLAARDAEKPLAVCKKERSA